MRSKMASRSSFQSAIKWSLVLIFLLQAFTGNNAADVSNATSTTTTAKPRISAKISSISTLITPKAKVSISANDTEPAVTEPSRKDKRQAQRGYTDIPIDERSFQDIANSTPNPPPRYDSDLPVTENRNSLAVVTSPYPPIAEERSDNSFFPSNLQAPQNLPNFSEIPQAAATILQDRRDDYFDANGNAKAIPGEAGQDYPAFSSIPQTSFSCKAQQWPGYYADPEARCQVFWICEKQKTASGGTLDRAHAFLCPLGTVFNQQVFVCDWWFNVDCNTATEYYSRNQFLYAGPGVGIDGSPTRLAKLPGAIGSPNSFVPPRPNQQFQNNGFANQVQSSNQIARVATVTASPSHRPSGPVSQNYLASASQPQQKYSTNSNQFHNQEKYSSTQSLLANRMQKNVTGTTVRPNEQLRFENVGGFQNNYAQHPLSQQRPPPTTPQPSRKEFNSFSDNLNSFQHLTNFSNTGGYSSTASPNYVQESSAQRIVSSTAAPRPNVSVEPKGKQHPVITFSGTISSTVRPVSFNTEVPTYNQGSSTLQTPKDFVPQVHQNRNNGGYQQQQQQATLNPPTTEAPITTTFRSSSTTYSSNINQAQQKGPADQRQFQQAPQQFQHQHQHNPHMNVENRQLGSTGSLRPSPSVGPSTTVQPLQHNLAQPGFVPIQSTSLPPPVVSTTYGPTQTTSNSHSGQSFIDRFGNVQTTQRSNIPTVTTTARPVTFGTTARSNFMGQRSNQYSNVNGQREIMYSSSSLNANVEFPYSPSQQKNKQKLRELESLKYRTSAKDLFAYPHFYGQRSNAYSDGDNKVMRSSSLRSESQNDQKPINHQNQNQLPGESLHGATSINTHSHTTPNTLFTPTSTAHSQPQHFNQPHPVQSNPQPLQHPPLQGNFIPSNGHFQPQQQHPQNQNQGHPHQHPNGYLPGPGQLGNNQQQSNNQHHQQHVQQHNQQTQANHNAPQGQHFLPSHAPLNPPQGPVQHQVQQQQHFHHNQQQQAFHQQPQQNQPHPPQSQFPRNPQPPPPQQQNFNPQHPPPQQHNFQHPVHQQQQQQQFQGQGQLHPEPHPHVINSQPQPLRQSLQFQHPQHQQQQQQQQIQSSQTHQLHVQPPQNHAHPPLPSPSPPFHERIVQHPSQNLQLPTPTKSQPNPPVEYTVIHISSTPSTPIFSKQILRGEKEKRPRKEEFIHLPGPTPLPNGLQHPSPRYPHHQKSGLSTTMKPPPADALPPPYSNEAFSFPPARSTTPSIPSTTGAGHRQNAFLPHSHGKRQNKQKQGRGGSGERGIQYPTNSVITTTISYPEGTGSLKVGVPGISNSKRVVDFSYNAYPKSSIKSVSRITMSTSSTPAPRVRERFTNAVSSSTRRPPPSSSPRYKETIRVSPGKRLAGSVVNKSTSSSTAIYVDTSEAEESVSTPVSISPAVTPAPAVSTSNFGMKISSMAKKKMAGAWQSYFGNGESKGKEDKEEEETKRR